MQCPVCDDQQLAISSREAVEIDYCPQCRGVWLDRGELDKILDRSAAGGGPAPAMAPPPREDQRYRDDDDRRPYDKRKKRRSFLVDIFDFD
jgi:Zn-finger nucleic acid-binding protein